MVELLILDVPSVHVEGSLPPARAGGGGEGVVGGVAHRQRLQGRRGRGGRDEEQLRSSGVFMLKQSFDRLMRKKYE